MSRQFGTGQDLQSLIAEIQRLPAYRYYGRVVSVQGLLVEVAGFQHSLSVGSHLSIQGGDGSELACEVVGFRNERALCMPFGPVEGVGLGCKEVIIGHDDVVVQSDDHVILFLVDKRQVAAVERLFQVGLTFF